MTDKKKSRKLRGMQGPRPWFRLSAEDLTDPARGIVVRENPSFPVLLGSVMAFKAQNPGGFKCRVRQPTKHELARMQAGLRGLISVLDVTLAEGKVVHVFFSRRSTALAILMRQEQQAAK